jgi:hypothetical protein
LVHVLHAARGMLGPCRGSLNEYRCSGEKIDFGFNQSCRGPPPPIPWDGSFSDTLESFAERQRTGRHGFGGAERRRLAQPRCSDLRDDFVSLDRRFHWGLAIRRDLYRVLATNLHAAFPVAAELPSARAPAVIRALPSTARSLYQAAFTAALHPAFQRAAIVAAFGFVLTWFLKEVPLRGPAPLSGSRANGARDLAVEDWS